MGDKSNQHRYIKALLKMADIDIRSVSRDYTDLRINEYFKTVEKFANRVPMVMEALDKIIAMNAADYDFRTIKDIEQYLEDIGYIKHSVFEEIAKAGKRGHSKFAADSAKKMLKPFMRFCVEIEEVHKTFGPNGSAAAPTADNSTAANYSKLFLKDILHQVDNERSATRFKILAVDDCAVALKSITTALSDDFDVFTLVDSLNVEFFLQRVTPDLILLDYKMPDLNGFELVPIIRGFAEHQNTPIIFLTATGTTEYVSAALSLGASDYIVKPVDVAKLRKKVAKHTSNKKVSGSEKT